MCTAASEPAAAAEGRGDARLLARLAAALRPHGLLLRGGFAPEAADGTPDGVRALLLVGNVGPAMWRAFAPHAGIGPHPLDRWTERVVGAIAARFGARPLYPFGGPPYWPFQRWALRAGRVHPSPLGVLIHARYGLWHAYRAALAFDRPIALPPRAEAPSPCASCAARPCLTGCPVGAFRPEGYDVAACRRHLAAPEGKDCMAQGCAARRACPVGREHGYAADHAAFHMRAFLAARASGGG